MEPLHKYLGTDDISADHAKSMVVIPYLAYSYSQPPCVLEISPLNQISQEDLPQTDRRTIDRHGPICPPLITNIFQEEDQGSEICAGSDDDTQVQRASNCLKTALSIKKRDSPPPHREDGQNVTGSHGGGCSDRGLRRVDVETGRGQMWPNLDKRKRPALFHARLA